ncbi:CinA family protein [Streptomyces sp. NPDC091377]|uniref:CinA family protein n=1 Tax=Streptomyces sp. NPDC091377 TaxID=3365995 RepID=UPI00383069F0
MNSTAADVVRLLRVRGETVAVAESLTGGLVAAALTAVPGASQVFRGSVTAYATDLKHRMLGVDAGLLEARGAVDPQVAAEMAAGVRKVLDADWGVATTGVAGPEPQDGQDVGTVFVAVEGPTGAAGPVGPVDPAGPGRTSGAPGVVAGGASGEASDEVPGASGASDPAAPDSAGGGKVLDLRLNGDREEIRMESVRSVLALLLTELAGEQTGNERAQDTEQNGGS